MRTVAGAVVLMLALAGLAPRLLGGQDRGVVRPPRPVPAGPALITRFAANAPGPCAVALSPDAKTLAVAGDHRITLWDVDRHTNTVLDSPETAAGTDVVAFSPDGRTLAAGAYDEVVLWDVASRTRRASLPMGTFNVANRLTFSPDGRVLAAGDNGGKLVLWDVGRRSRMAILSTGIGRVTDLAFRADGRSVVVGGTNPGNNNSASAAIIDVAQRRRLPAVRTPGELAAVAFRSDGIALAALGSHQNDEITLWDVTHRHNLMTINTPAPGVLFSRAGGVLAVAAIVQREVRLLELDTARRSGHDVGHLPDFHPNADFFLDPRGSILTNDGRLVIADGRGSVFVWSIRNP